MSLGSSFCNCLHLVITVLWMTVVVTSILSALRPNSQEQLLRLHLDAVDSAADTDSLDALFHAHAGSPTSKAGSEPSTGATSSSEDHHSRTMDQDEFTAAVGSLGIINAPILHGVCHWEDQSKEEEEAAARRGSDPANQQANPSAGSADALIAKLTALDHYDTDRNKQLTLAEFKKSVKLVVAKLRVKYSLHMQIEYTRDICRMPMHYMEPIGGKDNAITAIIDIAILIFNVVQFLAHLFFCPMSLATDFGAIVVWGATGLIVAVGLTWAFMGIRRWRMIAISAVVGGVVALSVRAIAPEACFITAIGTLIWGLAMVVVQATGGGSASPRRIAGVTGRPPSLAHTDGEGRERKKRK